jgi:hypothetical protein
MTEGAYTMPIHSRSDALTGLPESFGVGGRLQAERDAELVCRFLGILSEAEGFEHLKPPISNMSLGLALGLAAALRLSLWQIHGLSAALPETPALGHELVSWLLQGPVSGAAADYRGIAVYRYYSAVWSSRAAWSGALELGADILIDRTSQLTDSELELLADFLWARRRA